MASPTLQSFDAAWNIPGSDQSVKGVDYIADRDTMKGLLVTAGLYSLTDGEFDESTFDGTVFDAMGEADRIIIAKFYLIPETERTRRIATFMTYAKQGYTTALAASDAKLVEKSAAETARDDALSDKAALVTKFDTFLSESTALDGSTLISDRNTAQTAYDTADTNVTTAEATLTTKQTAETDAKTALDADPSNTSLQTAYATAQQDTIDAQTDLDGKKTTRTVLLSSLSIKLKSIENILSAKSYKSNYNTYQYVEQEKLLALTQAEKVLERDTGNTAYIATKDAAESAYTTAQATTTLWKQRLSDQTHLKGYRFAEQTYQSIYQQKVLQVSTLSTDYTELKAATDSLSKTQGEWDTLEIFTRNTWSVTYNDCSKKAREARIGKMQAYLAEMLGASELQRVVTSGGTAAHTYKSMIADFIDSKLKGISHDSSATISGIYDWLIGASGSEFSSSDGMTNTTPTYNRVTGITDTLLEIGQTAQSILETGIIPSM